ncbi:RNA helicase [Elasticomyces elasticus]|nr:RNA helicase [Elasticomyces elasticus]
MQVRSRDAGKCIFCTLKAQVRQRRQLGSHRNQSTGTQPFRRVFDSRPLQSQTDRNVFAGGSHMRAEIFASRSGTNRFRFVNDSDGLVPIPRVLRRKQELERGQQNRGGNFDEVLKERLKFIKEEVKQSPLFDNPDKDQGSFRQLWLAFENKIRQARNEFSLDIDQNSPKRILQDCRQAYSERGIYGLDQRLKYCFYGLVTGLTFTDSDIKNQRALADLRYPTEWFPATRQIHRKIHLHVGPTNSGKTYHALKRLEQASSGVYAGPLRLLAHEVYTRLNAMGKRCTLVTGDEKRSPDDSMMSDMQSCTVEMMPLNKSIEVAVIDEIQMIANDERGWAWTQAMLGVKANEVHLCGEERTVPLIRELAASVGEKVEVHRYERLSPLQMMSNSLEGDLKKLQKGDCIVSFSVMGIHALRQQIEKATGKKVATVYGSLPPETRAQQARLFNDPNNDYDFLVASDAIGMGLNLSIKRIIFEASSKFNGVKRQTLSIADIKQIAGRAGRYRTAEQAVQDSQADKASAEAKSEDSAEVARDVRPSPPASGSLGLVTTLEKFDFPVVEAAMRAQPEPIRTAGLFPPSQIVERFASYFPPGTPFSYLLMRLHELSQVHSRFHLCRLKDQIDVADVIESVRNLTIPDRIILCACPASGDIFRTLMPALARCIADQRGGALYDIEEMPLEALDIDPTADKDVLGEYIQLHKGIVSYLWLSYRFAGVFSTRSLAFHVKALVEEKIETVLNRLAFSAESRRKITAARQKSVIEMLKGDIMGDAGKHGPSDEQSSIVNGGDRFGGEEEIEILEPEQEQELPGADTTQTVKQFGASSVNAAEESEFDLLESTAGAPESLDAGSPADILSDPGNRESEAILAQDEDIPGQYFRDHDTSMEEPDQEDQFMKADDSEDIRLSKAATESGRGETLPSVVKQEEIPQPVQARVSSGETSAADTSNIDVMQPHEKEASLLRDLIAQLDEQLATTVASESTEMSPDRPVSASDEPFVHDDSVAPPGAPGLGIHGVSKDAADNQPKQLGHMQGHETELERQMSLRP